MADPLAPLLHDGLIDEVVARLKSGKEADLWLVRHRGEVVAAKVYKAREARSFRNNASYREGRQVRSSRTQRAMDRGSRFGREAAEEEWKTKEADALHALHAAGVRVPRPVLFYEGVLLMEVVTDADGHPAPRLVDAHVTRETAAALYADLRSQAVRMLCCDLVHGDLSPYNVLLGAHGPVIIDFPQVVGAAHNNQAAGFFERDLENLRQFFAAEDPALKASSGDGAEIWRAYTRRELTPDFVPTGRGAPSPHRGRRDGPERAHEGGGHRERPQHGGGQPRQHAERVRAPQPPRRHDERPPHVAARPPAPGPSELRAPQRTSAPSRDRRRGAGPAPQVIRVERPTLGAPVQQHPRAAQPSQPQRPQPQRTQPSQPQRTQPSQPERTQPSQPQRPQRPQPRGAQQPPNQPHQPRASQAHASSPPAEAPAAGAGRRRRRRGRRRSSSGPR
jgi:RIO kinase 1